MTDASVTATLQAPPIALAGGSLIFLVFLVVFFVVAYGYYTVKGSGISMTPYRRDDGPPQSPDSLSHDITQDVRNWERGTAGHHGHRRAATGESESEPPH